MALVLRAPAITSYSTNFDLTENPLREGGRWFEGKTDYLTNNDIRSASGVAIATAFNNPAGPFDDSIALINGAFGNNQSISGTVFRAGGYTPPANHELNLFLRGGLNGSFLRGYELNLSLNGDYGFFMLWKGLTNTVVTSFTQLASISHPSLSDGDVVYFEIVGTVLTAKVGVTTIGTYDTSGDAIKWSSGLPGIDEWAEAGATLANAGFTSVTALTI